MPGLQVSNDQVFVPLQELVQTLDRFYATRQVVQQQGQQIQQLGQEVQQQSQDIQQQGQDIQQQGQMMQQQGQQMQQLGQVQQQQGQQMQQMQQDIQHLRQQQQMQNMRAKTALGKKIVLWMRANGKVVVTPDVRDALLAINPRIVTKRGIRRCLTNNNIPISEW